MISMQQQLKAINVKSDQILEELQHAEPSLEIINERMEARAASIGKLEVMVRQFGSGNLPEDQETELRVLFEEHAAVNQRIQAALENLMSEQREKLVEASSKRKADDQYRVLKKPDISYF